MTAKLTVPMALLAVALAGCANQPAPSAGSAGAADGMDALTSRVNTLSGQTNSISDRVNTLSDRVGALSGQTNSVSDRVNTLSDRVGALERQVGNLAAQLKEVMAYANHDKIRLNGKEAFAVQLSEDKTLYPLNRDQPPSQDIGKLDELAERLARMDQDYHLEIQSHVDDIGSDDYGYALAKARAEAVLRYLHEKRGIPLSRMSTLSYGAGQPVDRYGQSNRRIVIRVLVAE